jgi:DNA polymerase lambda
LGDDRRSFSYYKAIPVVEKLPFKIESADQVKDLPGIGKSMQDHVRVHFCSNYYVHISSLD